MLSPGVDQPTFEASDPLSPQGPYLADLLADHKKWQARRHYVITCQNSMPSMVDILPRIRKGTTTIGTDPSNNFPLSDTPSAPPFLGSIKLEPPVIRFIPAPGVGATFHQMGDFNKRWDYGSDPIVLGEDVVVYVSDDRLRFRTARLPGDIVALMFFDSATPRVRFLRSISVIPSYTFDPSWIRPAVFRRYPHRRSGGVLEFTLPNHPQKFQLIALGRIQADGSIALSFKDKTNQDKNGTYSDGRAVVAMMNKRQGRSTKGAEGIPMTVDFNRAVNPFRAFTPHWPRHQVLPDNILPVDIRAGEKRPFATVSRSFVAQGS